MLASRLCLRAVNRPTFASIATSQALHRRPVGALAWNTKRVFATTPRHRKSDTARIPNVQQQVQAQIKEEAEESVKPETVKKSKEAQPATKNDPLLAEQTVSNKEQRQADWAIIKNMAHYLWPKNDFGTRFRVGLSVGLLIGAKVCIAAFITFENPPVDSVGRFSTSKCLFTSNPSWTA
jgi:ABC transporter ATM